MDASAATLSSSAASPRIADVPAYMHDPVAAAAAAQRTYAGRVRYFMSMTDPRLLLLSHAQLEAYAAQLRRVAQREPGWTDVRVSEYTQARRCVGATMHPETGAAVLWPFRLAAFVPVNLVTLCGMLARSQQTPLRAMGWQVANQTYNVGFNYCNGSGARGMSHAQLLLSYVVATSTACTLSYTLGKRATAAAAAAAAAAARNSSTATTRTLMSRVLSSVGRVCVPYVAVAGASLANLAVVRLRDCTHGIVVADAVTGESLCGGTPSRRAGCLAVAQVALSRVLIPVPLMLLPPLLLHALFDARHGVRALVARRAALYVPVNVAILVAVLQLALPLSVAVFPQQAVVPTRWLERRYRDVRRRDTDEYVTHATYNKGI